MLRSFARLFGVYLPHSNARFNSCKANILAALVLDLKLKNFVINPSASIQEASKALDRWSQNVFSDYLDFKKLTREISQCYGTNSSKLQVYWDEKSKIKSEQDDIGISNWYNYRYTTYDELYSPSFFDGKTRRSLLKLEMLSDDELLSLLRKQIC